MPFKSYKGPQSSPWGAVQFRREVIPGVVMLCTASHGGFWISAERHKAMHPALRKESRFYEEDDEAALVCVAFIDEIPSEEHRGNAIKTLKEFHPDRYREYFGDQIVPGQS